MNFKHLDIVEPIKDYYEYAEYVMSKCSDCQEIGKNRIGNLLTRYKTKGFAWACLDCQKKRASDSAKIRESKYSPEEKTAKAKKSLEIFRLKTGLNNPMDLSGARDVQKQSMNTESFRKNCSDRNNRLNLDPEYKKKLSKGQLKRIAENPEQALEQTKKLLAASRSAEAGAKTGIAISKIFAEEPERMKNATLELHKWNTDPELKFERYKRLQESNRANNFTSKGEREILTFIQTLFPKAARGFVGNKEVDIKIEEKKLCIEYNGTYWHSEKKVGKTYHFDKTVMCEKHGYRLIHIFDFEWATRKLQVIDFVKSALGMNEKIGARKCVLKIVDRSEAISFISHNHIQGSITHGLNLCLGLYYKDELISVATFGKHHRGNGEWILNRFCCKHGVNVIGGLSRLSKRASETLKSDIYSWADRRFSQGTGYLASGWEISSELQPDYFYIKKGETVAKQSRMKSKMNTPAGMTEAQHAELDGLEKVWDCGKIKMIFKRIGR